MTRWAFSRSEAGSVSIWALLLTSGAFTVLLGLVVDGGNLIDARLDAARTARQAARVGADQLSAGSIRSGDIRVDADAAAAAARRYLHDAGQFGDVRVSGESVTVTISGTSPARILSVVGIDSFPVQEAGTARGVSAAAEQ